MNQEQALAWVENDPFAEHPTPTRSRHQLLQGLHDVLTPRTYLEIGIRHGESLTLSRARTIGVDPEYSITSELRCDLRTFTVTSDDFFARPDPLDHFGGLGIDLAFIDGMHLSEFVLRDFINVEKHSSPGAVVVLDDVLPRNNLEASRIRRTSEWAGDVFKALTTLIDLRPDLIVIPINTGPTGTAVIAGLDPTNKVLEQQYERLMPDLQRSDPQRVSDRILTREDAAEAGDLLDHPVWSRIRQMRDNQSDRAEINALLQELQTVPRVGSRA